MIDELAMETAAPGFLRGGGEMGARMRAHDWSTSPLGPPGDWPPALRTVVGLMLGSKFPMFVAWGPELGFLYNDSYAEILGTKHPDALGRPFQAIWSEIWPDIAPLVHGALQGEATYHEDLPLLMRRKGYDEPTWFTFSYSPVRDETGAIPGMFCACTETTAQVLGERLRLEQIDRLRGMFEQAPGFMALMRGPEHVFELTNAAYQELIGHRPVLGKPLREALPEVVGQGFADLLDHVYRSGEPFVGNAVPVALRAQADDPLQERFVDFVYQPIRDASGTVVGVFVEGSDVTDRTRAMRELQMSDRRKDEFLAMLAHELRNPLSPISSAAQLLRIGRPTPDLVQRASEIISRQVGHMTRLVDDLLDVSRVTRGLITLDQEVLDVDQVVATAVEQVRPQLQAQRHRLTVATATEPVRVHGDRTRIVQVIANILGNAAKFTPPGGDVALGIAIDPDTVEISVRDSGIGIEPDVLPYVFDLFSQGERTPDRSQGGLGLGLALVRSLVALHGGSVEARSDGPGTGSEIIVRLPRLHGEPAGRDEALAPPAPTVEGALRVLVVDDNADAAHTLAALLEVAGHDVTIAGDAHRALELARRVRPQVMVLDIGLPDLDGCALARQFRGMPETRDALLVALTGYGQPSDRARSEEAGFDHHLVKPADMMKVNGILEAYARSRQPG